MSATIDNINKQRMSPLEHVLFLIMSDKKHSTTALANLYNVDPKTVKNWSKKGGNFDLEYWKNTGEMSQDDYDYLTVSKDSKKMHTSLVDNFSKTEKPFVDFVDKIDELYRQPLFKKICPEFITITTFTYSMIEGIKSSTIFDNDKLSYLQSYVLEQYYAISEIIRAKLINDKNLFNQSLLLLNFPFDNFLKDDFWPIDNDILPSHPTFCGFNIQLQVFFIIATEAICFTTSDYKYDNVPFILLWQNVAKQTKDNLKNTTAYELYFEHFKEQIININNLDKNTNEIIYEVVSEKLELDFETIRKDYFDDLRKGTLSYKKLRYLIYTLTVDTEERDNMFDLYFKCKLLEYIDYKLMGKNTNNIDDNNEKDKKRTECINVAIELQDWICQNIYNCPIPNREQSS